VPESLEPRAALQGDRTYDFAVVGAGFTGLWTAYYLKSLQPDARICVLESEIAGFGASGRNGGFVSGGIAGKRRAYTRQGTADAVLRAERETYRAVDEIGRVIEAEAIDCGYRKSGSLSLATTPPQRARLEKAVEDAHCFGLTEEDLRVLSSSEVRDFVRGAAGVVAASFTPHCARTDPARLTRGLAAACERLGVDIYEHTRALLVEPGGVQCEGGRVRANIVVRATESYTVTDAPRGSHFLPLYSLMIATEQLSDDVWEEVGWRDGLTIGDRRHIYYYAQRTTDGRVAIGGRGAPYRLRHPVAERNERDPVVRDRLIRTLHEAFPATRDAEITHHWGGSIAVPRDWSMSVNFDRSTGLAWAGGYSGHGVVASNIAGRTLADLILNRESDLLSLPWVGHQSRRWEPEPLRFAASWAIVNTLASADRYEDRTGKTARRVRLVAPFMPN
jgi:glycine/D-amino acid oxidase-like deaminating enzyme